MEGLECTARRVDATTVRVEMTGTVLAHRSLLAVRAIGYVDGLYLGADFLGDMPAGSTMNFTIVGDIELTASTVTCSVLVRSSVPN